MSKRIAAMLMCAVMVLVAAAPLALATHDVLKGAQGPRASAVTWKYETAVLGSWYGHIVNNGLRSLVVDVYDNTSGTPDQISHQRIRFAAYGMYPSGMVDTWNVPMNANHLYDITVTPNGPQGSTCTVDDMFIPAAPPVAVITLVSQNDLTVAVSGIDSTDDGTIVSYEWDFGDASAAVMGMNAVHTYASAGTYKITLVVTDDLGLTGLDEMTVTVIPGQDTPPVAAFTYTVNGLTVNVDATDSKDDKGIVSYKWSWGDGTTTIETGPLASHTYGIPAPVLAAAVSGKGRAPGPPHGIYGATTLASGEPVPGCVVTVKNMRTGEILTYDSTREFWDPTSNVYSVDGSEFTLVVAPATQSWIYGDVLHVEATKGTMFKGSAEAPITENAEQNDRIDVTVFPLGGSAFVTITLIVTDTIGQASAPVSQQVQITW